MIAFNHKNIPAELRNLNQWVGVRNDSKLPLRVDNLYPASTTNPETWGSYSDVIKQIFDETFSYPGFVFNDNGIVGIDIDCGSDEDGFITPLAANIISHCCSYTEISRSGRGFHILVKGDLPFKGKNNLKGVEIYKQARYFICTGQAILFRTINENQEGIDWVLEKYFPAYREESEKEIGQRIYTPIWEVGGSSIKLRPHYPAIPQGTRNVCLLSLAGMLHSQGYTKKQIYDELIYANKTACEPPLDNSEVMAICSSIVRYKR